MNIGKTRLLKRRLICRINDVCFGMHGHLSALLKELQYFFHFKKQEKDDLAFLYLQSVCAQLNHIISLTKIIENLGGYPEIISYKNNRVNYYKLSNKKNTLEKVALLDTLSTQILILEGYEKVKAILCEETLEENIDKEISIVKKHIVQLSEYLTNPTPKLPNLSVE